MLNVSEIRKDFPMLNNKKMSNYPLIYLDNAATTFKPDCVIDTVVDYYKNYSCNIHRGDYELSYQISDEYDKTRKVVANFINSEDKEVVFTSGASESLNLIAYGYGMNNLTKGDVILTCEAEHASNILPWFKVAEKTGATIEYIPLQNDGVLSIENFKKAMHSSVKVVTLAHISNVLGYVNPIKEITRIAHEYNAVVICDGAQSVPHVKVDVKDLDIDFLAFSGHKMCAATGVGIMYGKYDLLNAMEPFMLGGGSNARFDMCGNIQLKNAPFKFESGTPAIEAVLSIGAAIKYLEKIGMDNIEEYELELKKYAISKIEKLENVICYNSLAETGIITFNVKDVFAQDAACYLNSKGIAVRAGNHCAKILMNTLNTSETIRASFYFYNTYEEVDFFVETLKEVTVENCINILF